MEIVIAFSSLGISILAAILSIYTFIYRKRSSSAQLELQLRSNILSVRNEYTKLSILLADGDSEKRKIILGQCANVYLEGLIQVYDEACAKYLDNKIDKIRFKKTYENELASLYSQAIGNEILSETLKKHKNIENVCKEWEVIHTKELISQEAPVKAQS